MKKKSHAHKNKQTIKEKKTQSKKTKLQIGDLFLNASRQPNKLGYSPTLEEKIFGISYTTYYLGKKKVPLSASITISGFMVNIFFLSENF